ncbi:MAG: EcsC family protein, partial [Parafilimonas sp.]
MNDYLQQITSELKNWQRKMRRGPGLVNRLSKKMQTKINSYIPEKIHKTVTTAIKQMVRSVLFGAGVTTSKPNTKDSLEVKERLIEERIKWYKTTAAAEGGVTGAGG